MTIDTSQERSAELRRERLIQSALRYAWWLGDGSASTRKLIALTGWNLSRKLSGWLGRPSGALAWPLGLALLSANAGREALAHDMPWLERCFRLLIDESARPKFPVNHLDRSGIGYAALRLYEATGQHRYRTFAETLAQSLSDLPRTPEGWLPYAPGRQEILVDTLAFVCPFFTRMSRVGGRSDLCEVAMTQMEAMWKYGHQGGGWVFHGFDAVSLEPLGLQGWGRGVGWLLVALVDTIHELPHGGMRTSWERRCMTMFGQLASIQKADGHWPWALDDPASASDSSVTALVAYALARWHQLEPMREYPELASMLASARRALEVSTIDGRVMDASGEAGGIGAYSASFGNYLWSQAPAVAVDRILA